MKRTMGKWAVCIFLVAIFAFGGWGASLAAEKTYELAVATGIAPGITNNATIQWMCDRLERYSNGRLKPKFFGPGTLCSEGTCLEQLSQGTLDICSISVGNYGGISTNFDVLVMPFLMPSYQFSKDVVLGPIGDELKKRSIERDKIKCLSIFSSFGWRNLTLNKEAHVPDDIKGMKIRVVLGSPSLELTKAWGAVPINVPWGEIYQSFQTKLVDGWFGIDGYNLIRKFYEVLPFQTEIKVEICYQLFMMNLDKYNSLPPDLKKIVDRVGKEIELVTWDLDQFLLERNRHDILIKLKEHGGGSYTPTKEEMKLWRKPAMALWDKKLKTNKDLLERIVQMQK